MTIREHESLLNNRFRTACNIVALASGARHRQCDFIGDFARHML